MARKRTLAQLAEQVDALVDKLAALEPQPRPRKGARAAATTGDDLLALVERRNAGAKKRGQASGAVVYGGSASVGSGEYLWAIERPVVGVLAIDPEPIAHVLAILGSAPRIRMLLALIEQPRTAAELQRLIGSTSPGPVYHHLRDLLALGVVVLVARRYGVAARHVVPILAAASIALDLGARS